MKSFDGTEIDYLYKKAKHPKATLVFVHGGFFGNRSLLKNIYMGFPDYNIIALDNRGNGDSDFPPDMRPPTLEDYAKDIFFVLKKERIKKVTLIGASLGGLICQKFLELYPQSVDNAIIISSTHTISQLKHRARFLLPILKTLINSLDKLWPLPEKRKRGMDYSGVPEPLFHLRYGLRLYTNNSVRTMLQRYKMAYNLPDYHIDDKALAAIRCPVLIIYGEKDHFFSREEQVHLHNKMRNSRLEVLDRGTHNIYIHRSGDINPLIREFLSMNLVRQK